MTMREASLYAGIAMCLAASLAAAQDAPKAEIFGGYSYLQGNSAKTGGFISQGWDVSLVGNVTRRFGLEADVSDHYGTSAQDLANSVASSYAPRSTFLFGPHWSFRSAPRITPFAHALFGGVQGKAIFVIPDVPCTPQGCPSFSSSQTAFAMAIGGGIDLKATRHVSIRLIQADYMRTNFTGNPQNNARISAGIVFTFGRR